MNRRMLTAFLAVILQIGCKESFSNKLSSEQYVPSPGSLPFEIEAVEIGQNSRLFLCSYSAQGEKALFEFELGPTKLFGPTDLGMEAGNGNFIAQAGSDSCILLSDLKRILEAENMPGQVKRTEVLPFDFVRLGSNLSQSADGGFSPKTKGNWTTLKLFIAQGNQESEVYLNFNESLKKGQFAIKDSEYGDLLLAELAKVL